MTTEKVKRKLTAILSADVKGYSRLMGADEVGTIRVLQAYRGVMSDLIQKKGGRVVDSPGDNVLAEFASVVDALESAVEIQRELKVRNADCSENRRMEFRIGINLGDVVEEGERIYGDGVNIAARIEGLAEGGGICISGTAFDHIGKRLPLGYEFMGEQAVKNIEKLVRVYRVLMEPEQAGKVIGEKGTKRTQWHWAMAAAVMLVAIALALWNFHWRAPKIEPASKDKMAFLLPDKPSIAVLPFVNMSDDKSQEYLADGITENIISALSQVPNLFVIARNSTFTYKGKPVKVQQVAEELGVRYVLEGSVQKSGDTLRITAQLIDAITGQHVWSERYNRELKNIFALQDDITMKVITAFQVKLTGADSTRMSSKGTQNLEAYLKFLQAREIFLTQTKEGYAQAQRLLQEVMALDPQFPGAYSLLASIHAMDVMQGFSKSPADSYKQALELIKKAIAMDDLDGENHSRLGWLYVLTGRQYDKAVAECERGMDLAPNSASARMWMSFVLTMAGRPEEAVPYAEQALRLDPFAPGWWYRQLGLSNFFAGRYEEAIAAFKKSLNHTPKDLLTHAHLTTAYSWAGRHEEAREQAAEILRINPKFAVEERAKLMPLKNQADLDRYLDGLRKAGLPDKPPLPLPDKPSIAVLPFVNMSDDKSQEFFSDGLTEEIITALSKTRKLFVIARNSTFTYKGKPVNVQQVSRDLGVKYVLEGSVRRGGDQLRITAQLIDATTGNHLWAERYERSLGQIFSLQDDITLAIVRAMRVTLTEGEQASLMGRGTTNLDAYLKALEANEEFLRMNREGSIKAKQFAGGAIALDPKYAFPYAIMANAHMLDLWFDFGKSPQESMNLASEAAHKALSLDNSDPSIHVALCNLYIMQRQYDQAIATAERAVELCPSGARAHYSLGTALVFACRPTEALRALEFSIRLNPFPPGRNFSMLGSAYRMLGRYEEAIEVYKKGLSVEPGDLFTHLGLAVCYFKSGREEEARNQAAEVMRLHPKFSLDSYGKIFHLKDQAIADDYLNSLRKAGLK